MMYEGVICEGGVSEDVMYDMYEGVMYEGVRCEGVRCDV